MNLRRSAPLLAAVVLAAAAASPSFADDTPSASQPVAEASGARVPAPPPGKAQIVFFRPSAAGMLLTFSVHEGDKGIVKLTNGSYFVYTADPGAHTFTIESEAKDTLNMEVDAGEVYYVKQTMGMGFIMGHPHLNQSDEASFAKFPKLKVSAAAPSDKHGASQPSSAAPSSSDKSPDSK